MTPESALDFGLRELRLYLGEEQRRDLLAYCAILVKWNRTYNLTSIAEPLGLVGTHLLDSLSVLPHVISGPMLDVGSGGGLPGIPIAIAQPDRSVTLIESSEKKGAFLRQAIIELKLRNVNVVLGRVELWHPTSLFRVAISRAFASLADFANCCRHLVEPGGQLAAMKGQRPTSELAALPMDVDCGEVIRLHVPFLDAERHLVLCKVRN